MGFQIGEWRFQQVERPGARAVPRHRLGGGGSRPQHLGRGFTLIELLLAMTLLVLLTSVIVLNVEGMLPSFRIEGSARELGAAASQARDEAALTGKPHGIVYDLDRDCFRLLAPREEEAEGADLDDGEAGPPEMEALPPRALHDGVFFKDVSLGARRKKMRGKVKVLFDPDGPGMPHSIHLADRDGNEYTVEVNPFTGAVSFFEGYREFDLFWDEDR